VLIELTEGEIAILEGAALLSPRRVAHASKTEQAELNLLLAMRLIVRREGVLEITLLGQHVLKQARMKPGADR
jgi:hypothetical protein